MVTTSIDGFEWVRKHLEEDDPDLLREMVSRVVHELMNAEVDQINGAGFGERSEARVNKRNGARERRWDTRVGTIDVSIPKLRRGSYFPDWLLTPRRRAEQALIAVIAECYVRGVSTRRVDGLIQTLGIEGISKSQVSELAKSLDAIVEEFRSRPLDQGPYTYMWIDALVVKVREGGRIVNAAALCATAVNVDGHREILGLDVITVEDGAGWLSFLRGLLARGLTGTQLVTSDAHSGLIDAIGSTLKGAAWQRCRTHFARNLLTRVPKHAQAMVAALVRSIFAQPDQTSVHEQHARVVEQLRDKFPEAAALLEQAGPDILAFADFPKEHWRQIWSNNPQERLNKEIRRRTDVVGIFPNRAAAIRLIGAVLAEQHDEWAIGRRYMSIESLTKARMRVIEHDELEHGTTDELPAAV